MKPNPAILLLLLMLSAALFAACGGDDDDELPPRETTTIAAGDEEAIDAAVADVLAQLVAGDIDALKALGSDKLENRSDQFDRLADCVPENSQLTIKSLDLRPGNEGVVRVQIVFEVPEGGAVKEARRDWRFVGSDEGVWLLDDVPQCPFSGNAGETDTQTDTAATEAVPAEATSTP